MAEESRTIVLDAARLVFAARGYARTTLKGVASVAGVAPDLVRRYYGDKDRLFAAAMRLPIDPASAVPELLAPGLEGLGERLAVLTLETLGDPQAREDLFTLARAGASANRATKSVQDYLRSAILDRVIAAAGVPDASMRVALVSSYLVGVVFGRFVLQLEPLASASQEEVVRWVAPSIQALLDPVR